MKRIGKFLLRLTAVVLVLVLAFVAGSKIWQWQDDRKAEMTTHGPYTADLESLNRHELPQWFKKAKFGVMIHWGLYSVPGYAPKGKTLPELLRTQYGQAMTHNPYAEDYANAMKDPGSPTAKYHREHYGDAPYSDFTRQFDAGLAHWDWASWPPRSASRGCGSASTTPAASTGRSSGRP